MQFLSFCLKQCPILSPSTFPTCPYKLLVEDMLHIYKTIKASSVPSSGYYILFSILSNSGLFSLSFLFVVTAVHLALSFSFLTPSSISAEVLNTCITMASLHYEDVHCMRVINLIKWERSQLKLNHSSNGYLLHLLTNNQ